MNNILEYLEATAKKYPDKTAVDDGQQTLTWDAFVLSSKKIATSFLEKTKPQKPVVILAPKSTLTLATMMGAVYAGCFYVIVDPSQPAARIQQIFETLEADLVVTRECYHEVMDTLDYHGACVDMEELAAEEINEEALQQIRSQSNDQDLLYGIFTSGSTGTPKGIVVNHRSVIDFITHFVDTFEFKEEDILGNQAPFDFDVSVKDIYTSIMTGATLVLIPKEMFVSPARILDYICDKEVSSLTWAVSALCLISTLKGLKYKVPEKVKKILFSGEVMPLKQLKLWMNALPDTKFINLYGPSEITCNCTYYKIDTLPEEKIPIGCAFEGRDVFLLDDEGQLVKDSGVNGEICVAGESLATKYYNNPEETKKRFIEAEESFCGKRYYKTGDLGCYGEDGLLYFAGRKDFQIKHMGHRIELEEIERNFEQVAGVEKCCCMLHEKRNQLVAFYIGEAETDEIRATLKQKLPIYMIPHRMIREEKIPLNKNGKIDRAYFREKLEKKRNG